MPFSPPPPPGTRPSRSNATTVVAVVLAILLALVWLRSSDGKPLAVPAGLPSVAPAAVEEPPGPAGLRQGGGGVGTDGLGMGERPGVARERTDESGQRVLREQREAAGRDARRGAERRAEKRRTQNRRRAPGRRRDGTRRAADADRAGGAGKTISRPRSRNRLSPRQDPPATAPGPGGGGATAGGGGSGTGGDGPAAPEFALG